MITNFVRFVSIVILIFTMAVWLEFATLFCCLFQRFAFVNYDRTTGQVWRNETEVVKSLYGSPLIVNYQSVITKVWLTRVFEPT